jgi:hypothetical protein
MTIKATNTRLDGHQILLILRNPLVDYNGHVMSVYWSFGVLFTVYVFWPDNLTLLA